MKLKELLDKFTNSVFLLSIGGLCEEIPFWKYKSEAETEYWKRYKDREVISMAILMMNGKPELRIKIKW